MNSISICWRVASAMNENSTFDKRVERVTNDRQACWRLVDVIHTLCALGVCSVVFERSTAGRLNDLKQPRTARVTTENESLVNACNVRWMLEQRAVSRYACSKLYFRTTVLRRSLTNTSVHQRSHNALLVLYQRPRTIINVSSKVIERWPKRYVMMVP